VDPGRADKIERLINRCKQFRRIATRYEKRAANYQAMWLLAAIMLRLSFANTPSQVAEKLHF
jgi:transposase